MPSHFDERTPLLDSIKSTGRRKPTPLPKRQLAIILLSQTCEAIAIESPTPYVPRFVKDLPITHGDPRKVGYFSGLLGTIPCLAQAFAVMQWGRVSDHVGRKPIILIGLLATMTSTMLFGLQHRFSTALLCWCIGGLFSGNNSVERSVVGEITDSTNRSRAISLVYLCYSIGSAIGNLLGGTLVHPSTRFPKHFDSHFWIDHPYFLPGMICSSILIIPFIIIALFFKEKCLNALQTNRRQILSIASDGSCIDSNEPAALGDLFIYPVLFSISNYVIAVSLDACFWALFPLFLTIPVNIGGLGLEPFKISYIIASYQLTNACCQYFFFVPATRRFGEKSVFITAITASMPSFILLPIINAVARHVGTKSSYVWVLVGVLLLCRTLFVMSYGTIYMYITSAAPNERSLGGTHGVAQTAVSIARGICPALTSALFSFSIEKNVLGGYAIYVLLVSISGFTMFWITRLPTRMWDECSDRCSISSTNL
ncbi:major facilitator superfamily domain-containing protein [Panaeolus papilionaceus]|nr:major facilitator superfamily domain-containing protein [Panaeolus papilionaceus]